MNISTLRQSAKDILISKKFYEYTFIFVLFTTFLIWLFKIFYEGHASSQFNVFFRGSADFLPICKMWSAILPKGTFTTIPCIWGWPKKRTRLSHTCFHIAFPDL